LLDSGIGSKGGEEVYKEEALGGHLSLLVLLEGVEGMGYEEVGGGDCGEGITMGQGRRV
jgi:hypothetical protein